MLEAIKKILITQKKEELNQIKEVDYKIQQINHQERQTDFVSLDKKLNNLESQLNSLNRNPLTRILSSKKIKFLYSEYKKTSETKIKIIQEFNKKREELIIELSKLSHNSGNIEKEIKKIESATSLKDLDLDLEKAKKLLREYHNHNEDSIVQKVFQTVIQRKPTTKEEIFKIMQELFQTNSSAFVVEMKSTTPHQLANDLIEIGITLDKDKLIFLNQLYNYLNHSSMNLPTTEMIIINDKLDNYYCNEIKKVLSNQTILKNQSSLVLPQVMVLSTLISISKQNKQEEKTNKKGD